MKILLLLIILTFSTNSFSESSDNFQNNAVGFEITKPSSWHYMTAEENLKNFEKIELDDENFKNLVLKYSSTPLVVMVKHDPTFGDINPSIKVNTRPMAEFQDIGPKEILNILIPQFSNVFSDFEMVQEPSDTEISSINAAYTRFNYTIASADGKSFPITSELWIVPREHHYYMIGAGTRQDERTGTREEISEVVNTIKITK
ncbi:MAG: hypothetical protein AAF304_00055 [Pseudomonadota bacterium]